ncbi:hypothetical protein [Crossiella sp. NPDC003009]
MKRTFLRLWLVVLGTLALTGALLPGTALAVDLPGGKRIYAVTIGQVAPTGTTPTGNEFSRLAMYYFNGDGTVREGFWFWSWNKGYPGVPIRTTSAGCDNCRIHTAGGFQTGAEVKSLTGKYTTSGNQVTVTWDGGVTEKWTVATPEPGISAISLTGSNYGANVGQGYGSNASNDLAIPMNEVPKKAYRGRFAHNFFVQSTGKLSSGTGASKIDLALDGWKQCNGNCLSGLFDAGPNACTACPDGKPGKIRYYMASEGGRKNFYEHFCTCLVQGGSTPCYTGGSHRKPQLQVIDDAGKFRGWVGIEAQHREPRRGTLGVHWHVDL